MNSKENKKCLLGIDFQYDFMEGGSLPVNGATECAEKCSQHINNSNYAIKVFTCDAHPFNHCSFNDCGGEWPRHCVKYTHGAAIYDNIIKASSSTSGITLVLEKGNISEKEEYSIFDNPMAKLTLDGIFQLSDFDEIDVCGIVGTICVKESIKGLMKIVPKDKIVVLTELTANFDDGTELKTWLTEQGIKYV